MTKKGFFIWLLLGFFALAVAPALYAEADFEEVEGQGEEDYSDPSAFEGDSDSMPGERAPENLPVDDAPADVGIAVE